MKIPDHKKILPFFTTKETHIRKIGVYEGFSLRPEYFQIGMRNVSQCLWESSTMKVVPVSLLLSNQTRPRCRSTIFRTVASPCPVAVPPGLVEKKGLKICSRAALEMPGPLSPISIRT